MIQTIGFIVAMYVLFRVVELFARKDQEYSFIAYIFGTLTVLVALGGMVSLFLAPAQIPAGLMR